MAKRVRRIYVPVLTEYYGIHVYLGPRALLHPIASRHSGESVRVQLGMAVNRLESDSPCCPSIFVDNEEPLTNAIGTLAHEACHAAEYILEYICADDRSGELLAHTIGAVVRQVLRKTKGRLR